MWQLYYSRSKVALRHQDPERLKNRFYSEILDSVLKTSEVSGRSDRIQVYEMTSGNSAKKRKRGVVLTSQGVEKLRDAIAHLEDKENFGQKLTIVELGVRTRLTPDTVAKVLDGEQGADRRTLDSFFRTFNLELSEDDYCQANLNQDNRQQAIASPTPQSSPSQVQINGGQSPTGSVFYGRTEELQILEQWVLRDRCRLVTVLGRGGIGKSSLVARLIQQIAESSNCRSGAASDFQYVVWRSLYHASTIEETLTELIHTLSNQQDIDLPNALHQLLSRLMRYLNQTRCLLVLDGAETILQAGEQAGHYRQRAEGYGQLIRRVGELSHNSCLILTSRERPREMGLLEGKNYLVRSLLLNGLQPPDTLKLLQTEGLDPTEAKAQTLQGWYTGNPLELKIAATTIRFLFLGDIDRFLDRGIAAFGDIYELLDQQFDRLSELEQTVLYWLAIYQKPTFLTELMDAVVPLVSSAKLLGVMERLRWRSFIESRPTGFTLQNVVMEYVTSRFVEQVKDELEHGIVDLLNCHALLQATAAVDIRKSQTRLILKAIADRVSITEAHWATLLQTCRSKPHLASGYAAGNLLNLLRHCNQDLSRFDFSKLTIRQADLRQMNLQQANFDQATFIQSLLPDFLI